MEMNTANWIWQVSIGLGVVVGAMFISWFSGYLKGVLTERKRHNEVIEVKPVHFSATVKAVSVVNSDVKVHTPWYVRLERWLLNKFT